MYSYFTHFLHSSGNFYKNSTLWITIKVASLDKTIALYSQQPSSFIAISSPNN